MKAKAVAITTQISWFQNLSLLVPYLRMYQKENLTKDQAVLLDCPFVSDIEE